MKTKITLYILFLVLQLMTLVGLILRHNDRPAYDVATIMGIFIIYLLIEKRFSLHISNYVRGSVLLALTIHTFVGKYLNFYQTTPPFDNVLHVFGTYAVALFLFSIAVQILHVDFTARLNQFFFILLLGISAGAVYEVIEFLLDIGSQSAIKNQLNLLDTNLDMVSDLIGSFIAAYQECYVKGVVKSVVRNA